MWCLLLLNFRRVCEFALKVKFTGESVKGQSNPSLRTVFDGAENLPQKQKTVGKRFLGLPINLLRIRIEVRGFAIL